MAPTSASTSSACRLAPTSSPWPGTPRLTTTMCLLLLQARPQQPNSWLHCSWAESDRMLLVLPNAGTLPASPCCSSRHWDGVVLLLQWLACKELHEQHFLAKLSLFWVQPSKVAGCRLICSQISRHSQDGSCCIPLQALSFFLDPLSFMKDLLIFAYST